MKNKYSYAAELASPDDLEAMIRAVARERAIREGMAKIGEGYEVVAETLDSLQAMDDEAVLDLEDGQPTTLVSALRRYLDELEKRDPDGDELIPTARVGAELSMILGYPWSEEEKLVQLHNPHYGLALHVTEGENRDLEIRMGNNRWLVHTVNWEDAGSGGQRAAQEVAEAVYRATLARVIPDRDHHVQLSQRDMALIVAWWLEGARGSLLVGDRLTLNPVSNGGAMVRTRPYSYQYGPAAEARRLRDELERR